MEPAKHGAGAGHPRVSPARVGAGRRAPQLVLIACLVLPASMVSALSAQTGPVAGAAAGPQAPAERPGRRFSYGFLFTYSQARDDLLAPIRWAGPGGALRLSWSYVGARGRHDVQAQVPISFYHNRFGHKGAGLGLEAAYGFVHTVAGGGARGSVALGGHLRWDLYHGFYFSWDDEHVYWLNSYALGPRVLWRRSGERLKMMASVDIPLIALVSRPDRYPGRKIDPLTRLSFYFAEPNRGLELTGIPDFAALHARFAVRRPRSGLLLSYDFGITTYGSPARVITLSHRIGVSHEIGGR